nr:hypothetical protein [Tanacetum cinerariifolium]
MVACFCWEGLRKVVGSMWSSGGVVMVNSGSSKRGREKVVLL